MKLLFENWRKHLNEESDFTAPLGSTEQTADLGGPTRKPAKKPELRRMSAKDLERKATERMGWELGKSLGSGMYGKVYEVQKIRKPHYGMKAAMKVVPKDRGAREIQNYRYAQKNKASMPPEYAKYLPDVYQIREDMPGNYYIFMELLEELPMRIKRDLFGASSAKELATIPVEKRERIFKDPEALFDVLEDTINTNQILGQMQWTTPPQLTTEQFNELRIEVPRATLHKFHMEKRLPSENQLDALLHNMIEIIHKQLRDMGVKFDSPYIRELMEKGVKENLEYFLDKHVIPVHYGDPAGISTGGASQEVAAAFPETEGLMDAMEYFRGTEDWRARDVHSGNVMARPGTKDFVIVDLGLFKL